MSGRSTLILVAVVLSLPTEALAQPPGLSYSVPSAVAPGQTTTVTFYGGNLEGAQRLWTSFPSAVQMPTDVPDNGSEGGKVAFQITVPAESSLGVGGVRIATGRGVSPLRLLAIDDLPTVVESGSNKSPENAQEVAVGTAVDGACEPESFDYYKLQATPGMRLSVEVLARRLGSPLDPVVRLLDAQGRELAYSDDEPGIGADCRFRYEFADEGTYLIEIRDIRYQGGDGHRYRLRIGDFPLLTVPYPMGAIAGATARLDLAGPWAEGMAPLDVIVPRDAAGDSLSVTARFADGVGGAWARLAVGAGQQLGEFEPNDAPETASPVALPGTIHGRLEAPRDRDYFQFEAKAGQRLLFIGQTRTLGSPTDLFLRLFNAEGGQLAEADDAGTSEGVLDHTFAADGTYRLMVEDLLRRGGPEHAYLVEVRPYQPGFSLALEVDRLNPPQQGVFVAKVTAARRDYNGPIVLALEGAPEGIVLTDQVIPEGKNETVLRGTLPAGIEAGSLHLVQVVGTATIGEATVRAVAANAAALRGLFNGLPYPPPGLDRAVALGVGPVFPEYFKLAVDSPLATLPQLVGTATLKVKAERSAGFDDAIALSVADLPDGYTAEAKPIEKGKNEVDLVIRGPLAATQGRLPFRVIGSAVFQDQPRQFALDGLLVDVVPPLGVSATAAGPLVAAATQKIKVVVARYGSQQPAVALHVRGLPAGVTAPEGLTIPEGQSELEFELSASADAMIGAAAGLTIEAQTELEGRRIRVASPPVALEVQMQ